MKENNDDLLLTQFFDEHRREIADNGFSQRVMRCLPGKVLQLSKLWSACCFTLALFLFIALDGLKLTLHALRETIVNVYYADATEIDTKSLVIVGGVLLYLAYRKINSLMQF